MSEDEGAPKQLQIEHDPEQELPFEQALERLEQIVQKLDEGDLPLEQSIELFKEGMQLKDSCLKQLTEAEAVVEEYTENDQRDQPEQAEEADTPNADEEQ